MRSFYNFPLLRSPPNDPFYKCEVKVEKQRRLRQHREAHGTRVLEFKIRRHILQVFSFLEVHSQEMGRLGFPEEERCAGLEGRGLVAR